MNIENIKAKILSLGADNVGIAKTEDLIIDKSLETLCAQNTCGSYGKNWGCPPLIGTPDEVIAKIKTYPQVLVFQKIYPLEDSFDFEGMVKGKEHFRILVFDVKDFIRENFERENLVLGAGGCTYCDSCAATENEPCRFPDKAVFSLESYCVQVSKLAECAGMNYINGQNTVTYFGAIFFR